MLERAVKSYEACHKLGVTSELVVHDTSHCPGEIARAFNEAVERSTGRVVMILGDDDLLPARALQRIVRGIGGHEWGYGITLIEDEHGTLLWQQGEPWDYKKLLDRFYLGAIFFTRDAWENAGRYLAEFDGAGDYDLALRLAAEHEPVFLAEEIYRYVEHPGTDSNVMRDRQLGAVSRLLGRAA